MKNPWETIPLEDYEAHMSLDTVRQLQIMDEMMAGQLNDYPVSTALIFGVAGGNGLRHGANLERVYGVDINREYLDVCRSRCRGYLKKGAFVPVPADVTDPRCPLPRAELAVANLFVEYVGYAAFTAAVERVSPRYVSVGIQINQGQGFVSDSPYLHVFDSLETVHTQIEEAPLTAAMETAGYRLIRKGSHPLPNGKTLVRLDYCRDQG